MRLFFLCFFLVGSLFAIDGGVEGKVSYFYLTDSTSRGLFDDRILYGVEGFSGRRVAQGHSLFGYASLSLYPASGKTNLGTKTEILVIPVELGLKYLLAIQKYINLYLGVGVTPFYVHEKNNSPFVIRKRSKWDTGGTFKGGVLISPKTKLFFFDGFLAYYLLTSKFPDSDKTIGRKGDASALSVGGGLGWRF